MKSNTWIIGVALIALGILFSFTQGTRGQTQSSGIGRYQLERINGLSNVAWKIDTVNGRIWRCQVAVERNLPPGTISFEDPDMKTLCLQIP